MSKCRKAFEMAVVEHIGPEALAHGTMSIYQAAEIMYKAAWNAAMREAAGVCRKIPASGFACECVSAIEREIEK